jgi:hexosaminidase
MYPRLQEIGSMRNETVIGKEWGNYDGIPYGGYYTQDEIKEIVKYAKERYITIVPEIEMPGHSLAALASYPELGCTGGPYEVATTWGVFDDVYCAGNEKTFEFLEDVLTEVMELFPSEYIHIGGDECPKKQWEQCAKCQQRIVDEGLNDEHELQAYFITRMEKFINSKGRQIIGWDEILEGGLAPNASVMSWRGVQGGIEAAKMKHNVVMSPGTHCYFDHYQDTINEPLAIGGFTSLEKVYSYNPIPKELTEEESNYILGCQANLWTEYIATEDYLEYMALPRACALAEVGWLPQEKKNFQDFQKRMSNHYSFLEFYGYYYRRPSNNPK